MAIHNLLNKLPYRLKRSLKHIYGVIPVSIRYGKVFWDTYKFLQESQWWSREKLEDYQMQQLSKLLHHSYENVPYYRRVFDERGLKPKHIKDFKDFMRLPYLTKDLFKRHFSELIAKNVKLKGLPMGRTSGTAGKPLQFYEDTYSKQREFAFIYHQWSRIGIKPGDKIIQIRGSIIEGNKPIEHDPIWKVLRLSPKIDNKETIHYYLEKIIDFGARFLHGYPSTIAIFTSMIKQYGFSVPIKLEAVLFASETVYPWQREITQEVFNCRVFSHYGQAEKVVLASECENSTHYHCVPQYSLCEINEKTNEIIGTGFINYVNPLIRYQTTDIAAKPIKLSCRECGRQYYPIFPSVEGRLEDFIITPEGMPISPAIMTHPFKGIKAIRNSQIIQRSLDCIKLRIVPWDKCDPKELKSELRQLCQDLQNILGPEMKIKTEVVEPFELSKSSKFKWIISEVSNDLLYKGFRKA